MSPRPASIKVRALQWLAQREHSRDELRAKLLRVMRRNGAVERPEDEPAVVAREVDALLDWLAEHGYLSQARFVESRVRVRQQRYGNLRIRQELQRHGASLDSEADAALQASEFERARQVWQKKFGGAADDAAGRARQARFLGSRGFTAGVIRRVIRAESATGIDDDGPSADESEGASKR